MLLQPSKSILPKRHLIIMYSTIIDDPFINEPNHDYHHWLLYLQGRSVELNVCNFYSKGLRLTQMGWRPTRLAGWMLHFCLSVSDTHWNMYDYSLCPGLRNYKDDDDNGKNNDNNYNNCNYDIEKYYRHYHCFDDYQSSFIIIIIITDIIFYCCCVVVFVDVLGIINAIVIFFLSFLFFTFFF